MEEPAEVPPAEVREFLVAVAELPDVIETAEDYDTVEMAMQEILSLYQAFDEADYDYPGVDEAIMKLGALQDQLGMGRPQEASYDKWSRWNGNISVTNKVTVLYYVEGPERDGGTIRKAVGEEGFYAGRTIMTHQCKNNWCSGFYGTSLGKEYQIYNYFVEEGDEDVIRDVSVETTPYVYTDAAGVTNQYFKVNFVGNKPGTVTIGIQYFVNFHTRWDTPYTSATAMCPVCRQSTTVFEDNNWYVVYAVNGTVTVSKSQNSKWRRYCFQD